MLSPKRCQKILDLIKAKPIPPSTREIAEAIGINSTSYARYYLMHLEERGYIRRYPIVSRGIVLLCDTYRAEEEDTFPEPTQEQS